MLIDIKHEIIVFWSSFLCGQAIGMFFDFFRAIRRKFSHGKFSVALEDIVFCTVSFKMFFEVCNLCNNGALRWYIFFSLLLSGILYFCTISAFIIKTWEFLCTILMYVISPFKKALMLVYNKVKNISLKLSRRITPLFKLSKRKFGKIATKKLIKQNK